VLFRSDSVQFIPPSSIGTQLRWLMWREGVGMYRDKGALIGRFGITIFLYILYGLIFRGAGNRDDTKPDNLNGHFGALAMLIISAMFGTAQPTLLQFPFERPLFLREYSTGTYRAVTYFLSKIATELPLAFVQTVVGMLIAYFLIDMQGNFILLCISMWMLGCVSASVAMLVGSVLSNVKQASEAAPALFVPQILFSGFFIRIQLVPVYIRWVQYLCSLKYAMNLALILEFKHCNSDQTELCDGLLTNNDVEEDKWWLYALILIILFCGFRLWSLMILRSRAKKFFSN